MFLCIRQDYPFLAQFVSETITGSVASCNLGSCTVVSYGNIDVCLSWEPPNPHILHKKEWDRKFLSYWAFWCSCLFWFHMYFYSKMRAMETESHSAMVLFSFVCSKIVQVLGRVKSTELFFRHTTHTEEWNWLERIFFPFKKIVFFTLIFFPSTVLVQVPSN